MLPCPLPQSDEYVRTLQALGVRVRKDRINDLTGREIGHCVIQSRTFPLIGTVNLISRGPVVPDTGIASNYLKILDIKGRLIVNSNYPNLRNAGYLCLIRPKPIALLDLSSPPAMRARLHQNWRNALKRAEQSKLTIEFQPYDPILHAWLLTEEQKQQKTRKYRNWPQKLLNTFAIKNPGKAQVITAYQCKTPVAAMLILCHKPWATYHIGFTSNLGRRASAHTLILWRIMNWLFDQGYTTLDLGLLTGPDGLNRFKLRTGAKTQMLGGTWLQLPERLRRHQIQLPNIHSPSGQKA